MTPVVEAVHVPAQLAPPGSPQAKQMPTFTLNSHWGRADTGKKSLVCMHTGSLQLCPNLCDLVDCGLSGFSIREGGFSRQEYWSVLANTGCHTPWSTIFPAALATTSPEYLVLPEPL